MYDSIIVNINNGESCMRVAIKEAFVFALRGMLIGLQFVISARLSMVSACIV